MIDIDHFKKCNDTFGHGVGDQVLRLITNVLRERLRESDLPARYGGEELIAALPGAGTDHSESIAEQFVGQLQNVGLPGARLANFSPRSQYPSALLSFGRENQWLN